MKLSDSSVIQFVAYSNHFYLFFNDEVSTIYHNESMGLRYKRAESTRRQAAGNFCFRPE